MSWYMCFLMHCIVRFRGFKVIMTVNNIANICHVIQKYLISLVGKITAVFGILLFSQYYLISAFC